MSARKERAGTIAGARRDSARTMPAARSRDATAAGAEADAEADEETPEGDVALVRRVRVALACRLHKIGIEREPAKAKS